MRAHILYVSYDDRVLISRRALLEQQGYHVSSALGFREAMAACSEGGFHLFILGHSIPYPDKERLITIFRTNSAAPILSLWRRNERVLDTVNYVAFSDDPSLFVKDVATILSVNSPKTRWLVERDPAVGGQAPQLVTARRPVAYKRARGLRGSFLLCWAGAPLHVGDVPRPGVLGCPAPRNLSSLFSCF